MKARYFGSSFARFISPDPLPGHVHLPQTLNRYIYAGNNPILFTDPDGKDFYLKCQGKNTKSCQGGHAGTTGKDGKFKATVVKNDKQGNLVDNNGNKYTAQVTKEGVQLTKQGTTTAQTGVWQKGSANTSFTQTSGDLAGFKFEFSAPHWGQDAHAEFTFGGTVDQAKSALDAAGFEPSKGGHRGDDFRSDGGPDGDNSTHFTVQRNGSTHGDLHTGETNFKNSPLNFAIHAVEFMVNGLESMTGQHLGGDK